MSRRPLLALGAVVLVIAGALLVRSRSAVSSAPPPPLVTAPLPALPSSTFADDFSAAALDAARWKPCSEGDFREKAVDVQGGRLRLRCATIGTDDKTVKFLGARSVPVLRLGRETRVSAELDWNRQANGSYLSAALILAPAATDGNPLAGPDWLRVEYVGVPPGKNGRLVVASRTAGRERYLFMEGWPEKGREGRPLLVQKLDLVLSAGGGFDLFENGRKVYSCPDPVVAFPTAHLYVQMSSHSNYPARELFFDNVRWGAAD